MSLRGGGSKKDNAATAEAKRTGRFRCKNSFIDLQGREFLASGDWTRRVKEMYQRDAGLCQWVVSKWQFDNGEIGEALCGAEAKHPHHKVKRADGGDDSLSNLMSICIRHHKEAHPEKQVRWTSREAVRLQDEKERR
jgi:hypothetical protein